MAIIQAIADVEKYKNKLNTIDDETIRIDKQIAELTKKAKNLNRDRKKTAADLKQAEDIFEYEMSSGYETPPDQPITYEPPKHTWGDWSDDGHVSAVGALYVEDEITPTPINMNHALNAIMGQTSDIDAGDANNPLMVSNLVIDYYNHLKHVEITIDSSYMMKHPNLNVAMRKILLDWLVEVHLQFKCVPETWFLAVNIIDRYLSCTSDQERGKLQLVGAVAFLIAAKIEDMYPPEVRDIIYICDGAYTKEEIIQMTLTIPEQLNYMFQFGSPHTWVVRCLKAGHADQRLIWLACFILEYAMHNIKIIAFPPSIIAASTVLIARRSYGRSGWTPTLIKYIGYTGVELQPCVACINDYINSSNKSKHDAVMQKDGSEKFGKVSEMNII